MLRPPMGVLLINAPGGPLNGSYNTRRLTLLSRGLLNLSKVHQREHSDDRNDEPEEN